MNGTTMRRTTTGVIATLALAIGTLVSPSGGAAQATPPGGTMGFDVDHDLGADPFFTDEVLATGGENGFDCYRIPSLGVAGDGTVLASWDGRPGTCGDAPQPNSIVLRRSTDNGVTWTSQEELAAGRRDDPVHGYSDPSVLVDWYTGDIFNFHVKSYDVGIRNSEIGTDSDARNVLHAAYAKSADNGETWETGTVITDQITGDAPWRGRFATSGNGIQLQYGEHAGRLVEPAMVVTESGEFRAVTWLSDDHGESWFPSRAFGTGMDENKIVELSDGRLMNNSRSSDRSVLMRKISYSYDGGETWTEPVPDPRLPDPRNNASLIRLFPNAPEGSAEAKVLLFSNTASTSGRSNGTIRLSCDEGESWPVSRQFRADNLQYTSMATLPDGSIGLLFEEHNQGNSNNIHFSRFNLPWLGASCLDARVEPVTIGPGQTVTVTATVANPLGDEIVDLPLRVTLPEGWTADAGSVSVPAGGETEVSFAVTAPLNAVSGQVEGHLHVDAPGSLSKRDSFRIEVVNGHVPGPGDVTITPTVTNAGESFSVGDEIRYNFHVVNPTSTPVGILPSGELESFDPATTSGKNCRWNNFAGDTTADCPFAYHTVTTEDLDRGFYAPTVSWRIGRPNHTGDPYTTITQTLPRVEFGEPPTPAVAEVFLAPINPVQSDAGDIDVTADVTVAMRPSDTQLPPGAQVVLYVDGTRVAVAPVTAGGTATVPFTLGPVAAGGQESVHRLRARLVLPQDADPALTVGADARGSVTVLPADRVIEERTLSLGEIPDIISDGQPRELPLTARLTGPDGVVRGTEVTFTAEGAAVGKAITSSEGLAVVAYTVSPVAEGGQPRTVTVAASVPAVTGTATESPAVVSEISFRVLPPEAPGPSPEQEAEQLAAAYPVLAIIASIGSVLASIARAVGLLGIFPGLRDLGDIRWWDRLVH